MKRPAVVLAASALAALETIPALAGMGMASQGSGGLTPAPGGAAKVGRAQPTMPPSFEAGERARAAPTEDEERIVESFSVASRTSDGVETRTAPDASMRRIILDLFGMAPGGDKGQGQQSRKVEDPAFAAQESSRQVFGDDDRVQITDTTDFPFSTIGYIEGRTKGGDWGSCSGTLIGPRTVLTAAHCLYDNDEGGWMEDIIFAPALNGFEDAPYGAYSYDRLNVVQGYISRYQGYYSSVLPWDIGIITLKSPIGDSLGYLGYANYDGLGDFAANVVGYPGDKPGGTMWRATCDVPAADVGSDYFDYKCDTMPGSSGSSVYMYDEAGMQRVVTGVSVAGSADTNTAVRLNAIYVAWIDSLWK